MNNYLNKYILYKTKYLNYKYNNMIGGKLLDDITKKIEYINNKSFLCYLNSVFHILAFIEPFYNILLTSDSHLGILLLHFLKL